MGLLHLELGADPSTDVLITPAFQTRVDYIEPAAERWRSYPVHVHFKGDEHFLKYVCD